MPLGKKSKPVHCRTDVRIYARAKSSKAVRSIINEPVSYGSMKGPLAARGFEALRLVRRGVYNLYC